MGVIGTVISAIERGLVPDGLTRMGIRALCRRRLANAAATTGGDLRRRFIENLKHGPIAIVPELANEQHYEVPAQFFRTVLGPNLKYSCCHFPDNDTTLAAAEVSALELTCVHAQLADGHRVLELGCGWGSLSLWMASRYPQSQITAVSNSHSQREFIEQQCTLRKLKNLSVITADMNDFDPVGQCFDRVVSVEMFEHMRNYQLLLARISGWLRDEGRLFVHIFCHRTELYPFETDGAANWMGRYFFSGGIMPSENIFDDFADNLTVEKQVRWNGRHYSRTLELWLARMELQRASILELFRDVYGADQATIWFNRWRMFFMACSELFRFNDGNDWFVSHYLLKHQSTRQKNSSRLAGK